jgi:magnesium-transporting ATPase (P-type)
MIVAVTLALALAFEPPEPGIMHRPPRATGSSILDRYFLWRIAFVGTLVGGATIIVFSLSDRTGDEIAVARTVAVNTLVFGQVCYLFNARFLREASYLPSRLFANPVAWGAVGVLTVLQLGFVYLPFMNTTFETAPVGIIGWIVPGAIGVGVFAAVEVEKAVMRSRARR